MKNKNLILMLVILFFAAAVPIKSQSVYGEYAKRDGLRLLEIGKALAQMPEKGDRPEDFVPPHWTISNRAVGDLNGDGVEDFALILMLDDADRDYIESLKKLNKDDYWINQTFIIVVADSRLGDRKPHLNSINYQLWGRNDETIGVDERDEFKLAIKKNILDVNLNYGGSMRSDATFHFRFDPPTGGDLMLIGFDFENYCETLSENCGKWQMSENYLTNTRIETNYKLQGDQFVGTDKKTQISPLKIEFIDACLNEANHNGVMRPF